MRDLFPETLLVARHGERIYTTSVKIAEHFGKEHRDVLRAIRRVMDDTPSDELLRNFAQQSETYMLKGKLRQRPIYELTHDGFAVVAMGFTGPEAMAWKWKFLAAFRQQEVELADMQTRYLAVLDVARPGLRTVVKDFEDGLPRSDTAAWLGKSVGAVSYRRRQARSHGLLPAIVARPKVPRDRFGFPLDAVVIGGAA